VESSVFQTFKEDPLFFLLAILVAGGGVVLGIIALVARARSRGAAVSLGAIAVVAGLSAMGLGAVGSARLRASAEAVQKLPGLTAADLVKLRAQSDAEARHPLMVGLGAGAVPLLLGGLALVLALTGRSRPAS